MICKKKVLLFLTSFALVGCVHVQLNCPVSQPPTIEHQPAPLIFPCTLDPKSWVGTGCVTNTFTDSVPLTGTGTIVMGPSITKDETIAH